MHRPLILLCAACVLLFSACDRREDELTPGSETDTTIAPPAPVRGPDADVDADVDADRGEPEVMTPPPPENMDPNTNTGGMPPMQRQSDDDAASYDPGAPASTRDD